jgi:hypothetical protein
MYRKQNQFDLHGYSIVPRNTYGYSFTRDIFNTFEYDYNKMDNILKFKINNVYQSSVRYGILYRTEYSIRYKSGQTRSRYKRTRSNTILRNIVYL